MITFESFNRKYGVHSPEQISSPRMFDMISVEFPKHSVMHYLPETASDWGPEPTWWMIRKAEGHIWVDHLTDYKVVHGKAEAIQDNPQKFIRRYHQRYPVLKRVVKLTTALSEDNSVVVVNHALARHYVKYHTNRFLEYQRNKDIRDNIFIAIRTMATSIEREHFIPLNMPAALPTLNHLEKAEGQELDTESIQRFTSLSRMMLLEVWRWLGDPKSSVIGQIEDVQLARINFVFAVWGHWYSVNAAFLNGLRKSEANPKGKYEPKALQRRFLNGLMDLVAAGVAAEKKRADENLGRDSPALPGEESQDLQDPNVPTVSDPIPVSKEIPSNVGKNTPSTLATVGVDNSLATTRLPKDLEKEIEARDQAIQEKERSDEQLRNSLVAKASTELTDAEIDANLEALEKVEQIQQGNDFAEPNNPNADPLEEGILSRGRALAKDGLISGAEFRRIEALSTAYKKIKNPYGPGLLVDAANVTAEETVVKPATYNVKGPIYDESMLASTVREANRLYVRNTMHKDIMNCALAPQRSGIAVTGMEVTKSKSVLGEQDIISIRLQPVNGAASTIRAVMAVVDDEGVFKAGGTRYRMRTQRVDVPIRKVAPKRVALTSYYGKINIGLSDKAVHNYPRWLSNQISALSIDNSPLVKEVEFSNVFDQSFKCPKAYSTLSRSIYKLQVADMQLNFKHVERAQYVKGGKLEEVEIEGSVVCGATADGKPVLMDKQGRFIVRGQPRGTIEEVLGLDRTQAPHEMAVIHVRGQQLPLGVVMASYHGLTNLIAMLGATTRRVLAGNRMGLEPHEYPIRFSDETLVLDTREPLAMMLLSGWRAYHKQIRQMSIYSFDQMIAYQHLFDAGSRNGAYSVELELLDEQFIDPMTRDVLVKMREPTTWRPLLLRAAELLLTDYSPEEVDGAYMLYKGYERMPGAMYKEIVSAIRQYKLRSRVVKTSVDMKPTAVWNAFTSDSAISPVNDCNPIADLRASEAVTYIGNGGRSKRSMVARTRKFHKNDMGTVSEATVDSGDVGINIYMTANPRIVDTRGLAIPGTVDKEDMEPANLVSTSAMLSPGADIDDHNGPIVQQ